MVIFFDLGTVRNSIALINWQFNVFTWSGMFFWYKEALESPHKILF